MQRSRSKCGFPNRRFPFASVVICFHCASAPVRGQDLYSLISDARLRADAGNYADAANTGITALEAFPESQWDDATLRALITEVSKLWVHRMSTGQKQTFLESLTDARSPAARWTKGYVLFKLNKPDDAVAVLKAVIREHPDSVGADFAIRGWLREQRRQLKNPKLTAAVLDIVDAAPNNPATAWALCRLTWRLGVNELFHPAHTAMAKVMTAHSNTLAGEVATRLNFLLSDIESANYAMALQNLSELKIHLTLDTSISGIIRTFCYGIDWDRPELSSVRIDAFKAAFAQLAEYGSHTMDRSYAYAGLGYIPYRLRDREEALKHYQALAEVGDFYLQYYGWQMIGELCRRTDPDRAIAAYERFRDLEPASGITIGEPSHLFLAQLYLQEGRYAEGEELHRWLIEKKAIGEYYTKSERDDERLTAGLAGCLFGLGRDEEAKALADPLLAKYHYGTPKSQLTRIQRSRLASVLYDMGRKAEADKLRQGW